MISNKGVIDHYSSCRSNKHGLRQKFDREGEKASRTSLLKKFLQTRFFAPLQIKRFQKKKVITCLLGPLGRSQIQMRWFYFRSSLS